MLETSTPSTSYADHNTGLVDDHDNVWVGRWCYQKNGSDYMQMIQLKKTESGNSSRLVLPSFPGNIKTIELNVTDGTSTSYESGKGTTTALYLVCGTTYTTNYVNNNKLLTAGGTTTNKLTFDLTGLEEDYTGENLFICAGAGIRIWGVTLVYEKTATVNVESVSLDKTNVSVLTGKSVTLSPNVLPANATNKKVTWSSTNPDVATVVNGVVTGVSVGSAVITVTTEDQSKTATCSVSVNAPQPSDKVYTKVTSNQTDWTGKYLIVCEEEGLNVALDSSLDPIDAIGNIWSVNINDDTINGDEVVDGIVVDIEKIEGTSSYSIKTAANKYIGVGSNSNGLSSNSSKTTYKNDITYTNGSASIVVSGVSDNMTLCYNPSDGQTRFRYYKNASQKPVQLYKLVEKFTRTVTSGNFGTICLPYAVAAEARTGATYYNIAGVVKSGEVVTGVALEEETGALVAGKPYVFKATATTLSATYSGEAVTEAVEATGLVGTLAEEGITLTSEGKYILSNNKLCKLAGGTATIAQNRAYFDLDGVSEYSGAPESHVVFIEVETEGNVNGLDAVAASQRQEIYDLTGRRVSVATKGMFIINGKKVVIK